MSFLAGLRERGARMGARIGFPEATEPRTADAILRLADEGAVRPVIVESVAELDSRLQGYQCGVGAQNSPRWHTGKELRVKS